jgi:hypothetical protein
MASATDNSWIDGPHLLVVGWLYEAQNM